MSPNKPSFAIPQWCSVPKTLMIGSLTITCPLAVSAENIEAELKDGRETNTEETQTTEKISIFGQRSNLLDLPGSAYVIDEFQLNEYKFDDINQILKFVPGVNLQEEDGFGLRPNIGFRGAHPHRSRKITIWEDGVLIGPSPYAAPAAYYFPLTYRAVAVEVFKGPAAIPYGPSSVGGALNLQTRTIPKEPTYSLGLSYGSFGTSRISGYAGASIGKFSYLVEAGRIASDGFKELENGGQTGFFRDDIMAKFGYELSSNQSINVKLVRAHENSNESYLGLTATDFAADPYQRYAASSRDNMAWNRNQIQISHEYDSESLFVTTDIYKHWFFRNWSKISRFTDSSVNIRDVIADPTGVNRNYLGVLRGEEDSASFNDEIILGDNARTYESSGIQSQLQSTFQNFEDGELALRAGLKLHSDFVARDHTEQIYQMRSGQLALKDSSPRTSTNRIKDSAEVIAGFVNAEQRFGNLSFSLGGRYETISYTSDDRSSEDDEVSSDEELVVLGTGVTYRTSDYLSFFGGVNQGVTPVGPGQDASIEPEKAINTELGLRWRSRKLRLDTVFFRSDYQNIKGTCSFSAGCADAEIDREFNGGEALVQGLEFAAGVNHAINDWRFSGDFSYTYTDANFAANTTSDNPEWGIGDILSGDPLPYIAKHRYNFQTRVGYQNVRASLNLNYQSKMFDQAVAEDRQIIPEFSVVDINLSYFIGSDYEIFTRVENLLDKEYLVSLRPYGARPGRPRFFSIGINWLQI